MNKHILREAVVAARYKDQRDELEVALRALLAYVQRTSSDVYSAEAYNGLIDRCESALQKVRQ